MSIAALPVAGLAWLGRQGARALAASVAVGIAVPPIGIFLKAYITETVFILLAVSFLRVDPAAVRRYVRRPLLVLGATAWTMLIVPALFGAACLMAGVDREAPGLFLGLMLQAVASPMMAAPAFAALMGLDATLALMTLVLGTALVPLTAPLFAWLFFGPGLDLSPAALGFKLFAILSGSAVLGLAGRRLWGAAAIDRYREEIDGFSILILFVFVAAVMSGVAGSFIADPLAVLAILALGFAVFLALLAVSTVVFWRAGRERSLAVGFLASQRNMGLMFAAAGAGLPDLAWLYFAMGQFPIYMSPQLLKPLVRRLVHAKSR